MPSRIRIALVGDHDPGVTAHAAIPGALRLAGRQAGCEIEGAWIGTQRIEADGVPALDGASGVWCVPASPYRSRRGALDAIRWARERRVPFLGTCGGYQHALLEYARDVLGHAEAGSAEEDPGTPMPLISALSCSLVEKRGEIAFAPGSRLREIFGAARITEAYHCSYGLNPAYLSIFEGGDLAITGWDPEGDPRAFEHRRHPFFLGTAFQPERSALAERTHPLITSFVRAAAAHAASVSGAAPA